MRKENGLQNRISGTALKMLTRGEKEVSQGLRTLLKPEKAKKDEDNKGK